MFAASTHLQDRLAYLLVERGRITQAQLDYAMANLNPASHREEPHRDGFHHPTNDPTAHAEMIALTAAASSLESKWLKACTLYVTLEPCPMCAGAIVLSRIPTVVFGSYDPKMGACGTLFSITDDSRLNHRVHTIGGVLDAQCGDLLKQFFRKKRMQHPS